MAEFYKISSFPLDLHLDKIHNVIIPRYLWKHFLFLLTQKKRKFEYSQNQKKTYDELFNTKSFHKVAMKVYKLLTPKN